MISALICAVALGAPPSDEQLGLLKTFRKEFIAVTPGRGGFAKSFQMGGGSQQAKSQQPAHEVVVGYDFHIACYEVPQDLWQTVMGKNPSRWKGKRNSVEMLSYDEAVAFCRKATSMMREAKLIGPKQVIRLPSEAEWEYTARAGTKTVYSFGDDVSKLNDYGWHTGNASGNDPPVGAKKPNPWKLYDVHGYLWEWCADTWHEDYRGAPGDGSAWTKGGDAKHAVLRGGSWKDKVDRLTSRHRRAAKKDLRDDAVGLRCVLAGASR